MATRLLPGSLDFGHHRFIFVSVSSFCRLVFVIIININATAIEWLWIITHIWNAPYERRHIQRYWIAASAQSELFFKVFVFWFLPLKVKKIFNLRVQKDHLRINNFCHSKPIHDFLSDFYWLHLPAIPSPHPLCMLLKKMLNPPCDSCPPCIRRSRNCPLELNWKRDSISSRAT